MRTGSTVPVTQLSILVGHQYSSTVQTYMTKNDEDRAQIVKTLVILNCASLHPPLKIITTIQFPINNQNNEIMITKD
jgi:hypothetical protein